MSIVLAFAAACLACLSFGAVLGACAVSRAVVREAHHIGRTEGVGMAARALRDSWRDRLRQTRSGGAL